jgi:hypothetical protein
MYSIFTVYLFGRLVKSKNGVFKTNHILHHFWGEGSMHFLHPLTLGILNQLDSNNKEGSSIRFSLPLLDYN